MIGRLEVIPITSLELIPVWYLLSLPAKLNMYLKGEESLPSASGWLRVVVWTVKLTIVTPASSSFNFIASTWTSLNLNNTCKEQKLGCLLFYCHVKYEFNFSCWWYIRCYFLFTQNFNNLLWKMMQYSCASLFLPKMRCSCSNSLWQFGEEHAGVVCFAHVPAVCRGCLLLSWTKLPVSFWMSGAV